VARETVILSEFVSDARRGVMPTDVFDYARLYVLDAIGSMIIGATKPWSQIAIDFAVGATGSTNGPCTVVGSPSTTGPQAAAFANGTSGHGFEIDDVHDESLTHPGVVVVPAALAVAEKTRASGAEFIMSVVLGYEVNGRVGLGVGAVSHMLRGFYPTGTSSVFGATAAAARLLAANPEQCANAFGIAGSLASGIVEFAESGGMVKRMHAGRAAEGGVTAAYLARAGFTGPNTVLEGRFGFCRTFSNEPAIERIVDGLGTNYKIREITVKPYACCSDIHPVIDALLELKARHDFDPADVIHVLVESTTKLLELNNIDGSTSMMAAQYSVPFTVALVLFKNIYDPRIYQEDVLANTDLFKFQRRVEMRSNEEFDRLYPKAIAARVIVTLVGGKTLEATNRGAAGSIHNPLSRSQIESKFMMLADPILPPKTASEIVHRVRALEDAPHVLDLVSLLRFDVRAPGTARTYAFSGGIESP
jgi:2-methylcitrate dehydratase PrpD